MNLRFMFTLVFTVFMLLSVGSVLAQDPTVEPTLEVAPVVEPEVTEEAGNDTLTIEPVGNDTLVVISQPSEPTGDIVDLSVVGLVIAAAFVGAFLWRYLSPLFVTIKREGTELISSAQIEIDRLGVGIDLREQVELAANQALTIYLKNEEQGIRVAARFLSDLLEDGSELTGGKVIKVDPHIIEVVIQGALARLKNNVSG